MSADSIAARRLHLRLTALLSVASLISGCKTTEDYRWKQARGGPPATSPAFAEMEKNFQQPSVEVYSFATPAPAATASPEGLAALSDHGQAAFVSAYAAGKVHAEALDSLVKSKAPAVADPISWNRTMVVTVSRAATAGPADRLIETKVVIWPVNFIFSGYSVVATDTKSVDIAKLETDVDRSFGAELDPSFGGATTGKLTANLDRKTTNSTGINQSYENLDVGIKPENMSVYRHSERNLDLSGNTLVALTLTRDAALAQAGNDHPVFVAGAAQLTGAKGGRPVPPANATLSRTYTRYPIRCPLTAFVELAYNWRHVTNWKDARSYRESDDHVVIWKDIAPATAVIVPARDVVPDQYQILIEGQALHLKSSLGEDAMLVFPDYESAWLFGAWMRREHATTIGKLGDQLYIPMVSDPWQHEVRVEATGYPKPEECTAAATKAVQTFNQPLYEYVQEQTEPIDPTEQMRIELILPSGKKLPAPASATASHGNAADYRKAASKLFNVPTNN